MKAIHTQSKIICVGPNCWGSGKTIEEAWKNCREQWPKYRGSEKPDKKHVKFFFVPASIFVNDMGGLSGPIEDVEDILEIPVT
jgi:hypothetical protein